MPPKRCAPLRGTPLIAQLFMFYYGLPQFGIELDPIPSAMIGLSLNTAAYAAETLRAAISSSDKGQWEAAASIGMTPWQTMRRAILPQAARVALPPLSNSFISLVKDTSLAATIQVPELFRQAQLITPIPSALIGVSLNTAAYAAETLRAAISSIDKGQWEAAAIIGMTPWQTMRRAILPQAARVALPPLANSFISLVKATSLAATIQVPELVRQAQLIPSRTLEVFTMYLAASLIYWIMATELWTLLNQVENQLNRVEREPK